MDKPSFRLPGQNLPELEKVVIAYIDYNKELSTRELAGYTRVVQGVISRNVGFLIDFRILEEGVKNKYKLTSAGRRLAQAIYGEHPNHMAWCEILTQSGYLESILHPLKVTRKGIAKEQLAQSLFQVAKKNQHARDLTKHYRLGAMTLIEALKEAGIIREKNNKLVLIPENEWGSSDDNASPAIPVIDWGFVTNDELKALLARDHDELTELRNNGDVSALKSKLVLCGSILEAVLVSILSDREQSAKDQYYTCFLKKDHPDWKVPALGEWGLHQLIGVSTKLGFLDDNAQRIAGILKDYRNLVHPMVEIRRGGPTITPRIVVSVLSLSDHILEHLSKPETSNLFVGQNATG